MPVLEPLRADHAAAVLEFERVNRAFFARSVPDRGDDYFSGFAARHAALLAEQATGRCRFHVLTGDDGAVLGRFNLVDLDAGRAELGFRVAERMTGRGLATLGVRRVCVLARDGYGLRSLYAVAARSNAGSLAVLRGAGFVPEDNGLPDVRHVLDLTTGVHECDGSTTGC